MATKLNQIIAIEKGIKSSAYSVLSEVNKVVQKPELFNGFAKTYQPKDEDGENLPAENKRVQYNTTEVLSGVERALSGLLNITARKDWTNCVANADVVVDDQVIFKAAPVSFLLFLEKQLTDIRTLVGHMPILDEAEDWEKDKNSGLYKTKPTQTHRTKKIVKSLVLIQPTVEHPGQAQLINEDIIAGFWNQVKLSGAIPKTDKMALQDRVEKLLVAVKQAREAANIQDEVTVSEVGTAVFNYLLGEQN